MIAQTFFGFKQLAQAREQLRGVNPFDGVLNLLNVRVIDDGAEQIPAQGPCVVVANHPHGILDGAVVMSILRRKRDDVKILANNALEAIDELRGDIVAIDLDKPRPTRLKEAITHVANGGLLVIFPAGTVSTLLGDEEWNTGAARLIEMMFKRAPETAIVPLSIAGRNSLFFHFTGLLSRKFRTALLLRELWNKRGRTVEVRIGKPAPAARVFHDRDAARAIRYLRWRVDLLAKHEPFRTLTARPLRRETQPHQPVVAPQSAEAMAAEITALPVAAASGELTAHIATANVIPKTLLEIGRLREITFRAAGEGTGTPCDLDAFDKHYLHLFLWNAKKREIAGAYRLKPVDATTPVGDLYTSTLFHYDKTFLRGLGSGVELGRSFIRTEYQRSFSALLLLWKAIGAWVVAHPEHTVLFGPVSISNRYGHRARQAIYSFLSQTAWLDSLAKTIRARTRFGASRTANEARDVDELDDAVGGIPVLLRQYLKLGGKLVGFNVDSAFGDVLDGMIVVDLRKTDRKLLDRYFTREGAEKILSKGTL